jgi:hypothetical protein
MHQNAIIAIAATLGIAAGAGATYVATSQPKVEVQAISKAELLRLSPLIHRFALFRLLKRRQKPKHWPPTAKHMRRLLSFGIGIICRKSLWHSANVTRPGQGQVSLA